MTDLKQELLPVNLLDWIRLYDMPRRINYALEFLTAATDRSIEIPNAEKYQLTPGIPKKDLCTTIEETSGGDKERIRSRKKGIIALWRKGIRPWAIKAMDDLRGHGNADFEIDLFNTKLYDGSSFSGVQMPYAVETLPGIAYLFGSVLFSGQSIATNLSTNGPQHRNQVALYPSRRLPRKELEDKLEGIITSDMTEAVALKQGYGNLLSLLGLPQGRKSMHKYDELGLGFIENLYSWLKGGTLDEVGKKHATDVLVRFVESLVDHRYLVGQRSEIYLPTFRDETTAERFGQLVLGIFSLVNPDLDLRNWNQERDGTWIYYLTFKAKDAPRLEKKFPVYKLGVL